MRLSITNFAKVALTIGAAALGVAACGGGEEEGASTSAGTGIVSVASVDGTDVLADSDGRTLYSTEVEKGGKIRCVEACTSFWDPVLASPGEAKSAMSDLDLDLGVVK